MEGIPVLIVFAPILVPAMEAYGVDTMYFGVVLVLTVLVGSITPPVGSLLYLGASIAQTTVSKAGKEVWIFVAMIMVVIALLGICCIIKLLCYRAGYKDEQNGFKNSRDSGNYSKE